METRGPTFGPLVRSNVWTSSHSRYCSSKVFNQPIKGQLVDMRSCRLLIRGLANSQTSQLMDAAVCYMYYMLTENKLAFYAMHFHYECTFCPLSMYKCKNQERNNVFKIDNYRCSSVHCSYQKIVHAVR